MVMTWTRICAGLKNAANFLETGRLVFRPYGLEDSD